MPRLVSCQRSLLRVAPAHVLHAPCAPYAKPPPSDVGWGPPQIFDTRPRVRPQAKRLRKAPAATDSEHKLLEENAMRRIITLVGALGLLAAACSGAGAAPACEAIADDTIALLQELVDEFAGMSFDELAAVDPGAIDAELDRGFERLEAEAVAAECDDETMGPLVEDRLADLSARTEIGRSIIDSISVEGF